MFSGNKLGKSPGNFLKLNFAIITLDFIHTNIHKINDLCKKITKKLYKKEAV